MVGPGMKRRVSPMIDTLVEQNGFARSSDLRQVKAVRMV